MAAVQGFKEILVKFNDNVQAKLNVVLINPDNQNPVRVYGNIKAQFGPASESIIFYVNESNAIEISPGQSIPLSMSEVVMSSAATNLQIVADLKVVNSPDDQYVKGIVILPVGKPGESNQVVISGEHISVQVNVLWG